MDAIAKADHLLRANKIWTAMTKSEQHGVRFGLFPHHAMKTAEADGFDGLELCLALMRVATENGGMRA